MPSKHIILILRVFFVDDRASLYYIESDILGSLSNLLRNWAQWLGTSSQRRFQFRTSSNWLRPIDFVMVFNTSWPANVPGHGRDTLPYITTLTWSIVCLLTHRFVSAVLAGFLPQVQMGPTLTVPSIPTPCRWWSKWERSTHSWHSHIRIYIYMISIYRVCSTVWYVL